MAAAERPTKGAGLEPLLPAPTYTVHEKQRLALESDARYKVLEWGRRGGKNVVSVIDFIEHARAPWESDHGSDDPARTKMWWVARSYDQAEKYGFLPMLDAVPDSWVEDVSRTAPYELDLVNGVKMEFRTYDHPDTLQGAGVDRMLVDEADYMKDTLWYDDLEPMLMDTGGAVTFISKPVRPRSYFRTLAERGQSSQWPQHLYIHATSADNPFIADDPMDKRGTMPDHKFQQQYLAELPDDGGQVFKHLGSRMFTLDARMVGSVDEGLGECWLPASMTSPPFAVGVDFARHRDYRVTTALDHAGRVAYWSRDRNEDWDTIEADVRRVHAEFPGVVVPDASRDNKIVPDLANAGVRLAPEKFSPKRKKELIENLITMVEAGDITAADDGSLDEMRLELRAMEREVTASSYTRYNAPDGGHDDTVDSLALAASRLDAIAEAGRLRERREADPDAAVETGVSGI